MKTSIDSVCPMCNLFEEGSASVISKRVSTLPKSLSATKTLNIPYSSHPLPIICKFTQLLIDY